MSTMTERVVRPRAAARKSDVDRREYRTALHALVDLAAAAADCSDTDELLGLVAQRAADVVGVQRCSLYLRDERTGAFDGRAAHPSRELEAHVRQLRAGGEADTFTRDILVTRAPVLIRDTATDARGAQSALRTWKVRAVLGVPMLHGDEVVGLLFFDNAEQPHPYTRAHVEMAAAIGRLAGTVVVQALAAARLRARADTAGRQNRLMRSAMTADNRFSQIVVSGGGLRSIAGALAQLSGKPTALYDAQLRRVAAVGAPDGQLEVRLLEDADGAEAVSGALRDIPTGASAAIGPMLAAGVRRRHLAAPVDLGDRRWGWVVLMEHPGRLNALDEMLVRRAAKHAALELAAEQRADTAAWDARSLLARQLIRGTQDDDVRRSADHLGVDLDRPRLVGFVTRVGQRGEDIDPERLVAALEAGADGDVLATKGPEGVAFLIDVPAEQAPLVVIRRAKALVAHAINGLGGEGDVLAGISAICREPRGVPRAYREAREVARCIDNLARTSSQRVLAADDLGPGRLFVANGEGGAIERFVHDVIGPLLAGDQGTADLLRTLQVFFDTDRGVRLSAARLGIHENTVRYRLARVNALTGLDVAGDASDQLTVQMSLLVLRLQGNQALPDFAGEEAGA